MPADKFARKYRIASARAAWWDYSRDGVYFVTICTDKRKHFFGHIANKEMILSALGKIAHQYWQQIPQHFPFVSLDEFVIMPNHVHGIIVIDKSKYGNDNGITVTTQNFASPVETHNNASLPQPHPLNKFGPQSQNLGSIVRGFKSAVKTYATTNHLIFGWQSRFHDHIIRNEMEYHRIAEYIRTNPERWERDKFFATNNV